jgi:hypothetical protein
MMISIKVYALTAGLLLGIFMANAQQLTPQAMNSGGSSMSGAGITLDMSIGELAVMPFQAGNIGLEQGFQHHFPVSSILPVTGLQLEVTRLDDRKARLVWSTQQEWQNKGFVIERKRILQSNFDSIGFVAAATADGNSDQPRQYSFTDGDAGNDKSFYRLRQVDLDGKEHISAVVMLAAVEELKHSIKAWPVPARGPVMVQSLDANPQSIQLFDMQGRLLGQWNLLPGQTISLPAQKPGTYLFKSRQLTQKLVWQ